MRTRRRAIAAFITGSLLTVTSVAAFVGVAAAQESAEDFRTEAPGLGGFTVESEAAPLSIQLFEPVIPVPAGPGEPHGELSYQYTRTTLGAGPTSRGVASSVWPGPTVGDGLPTIDPNLPQYPIKADARYPEGPYESTDRSAPTGAGMQSYARGLDVWAQSESVGELFGQAVVGTVRSESTSTVTEEGLAVAESTTSVSDLSILGVVQIASLETRMTATSDGETAESDGDFVVSGLTIEGQGYELTDDGLVATGGDQEPIEIPLGLEGTVDLRELIGVKVEAMPVVTETDGATATRSSQGVRIVVDTQPLKDAIGFLPLADVISQIPDSQDPSGFLRQLKANLYTLATLGPRFEFFVGGASVTSGATLPISFEPPALPPPAAPPPPSSNSSGVGSSVTLPDVPAVDTPPADVPAPQVADQPTQPTAPEPALAATTIPEQLSTPLSAGVAGVGVIGIALMAYGLTTLTSSVFGASSAVAAGGAPPDLRAFMQGAN